ncbi:MAG TPA: peptide ABC transporter substrate-binding protein [Myxococcota bacterium]|nr:peptide ABC transporter substrate-binding protein [Myxococcota bacterium]
MRGSRPLLGLVLLLVAALAASAFALRGAVRPRAELVVVNGAEPRTLDPALMTGAPEGRVADAIFEGLAVREPRTLRPVPGVAERWDVSPDALVWTFHLRADARWSDGRPVTARDFAWSWRRLLDPATGSEYAYLLHPLRYAEEWNTHAASADALEGAVAEGLAALRREGAGQGVPAARFARVAAEVRLGEYLRRPDPFASALLARRTGRVSDAELARLAESLPATAAALRASAAEAAHRFGVDAGAFARDERTLVVELRAPTPWLLELVSFYPTYPVPRDAVLAAPHDWFLPGRSPGNGPFRLAEWRVGERIRLERSDAYWGRDGIRLASVDVLPTENATTALNLYLAGEVDWLPAPGYPVELVDALRERPDFYAGPGFVLYFYRFNCERRPFDDPRVRLAFALAVDREGIVRDVLRLGQLPAYHVVPPGLPSYERPASALRFDPARARALLAEAGFPDGRGLPTVGILYNTAEVHRQIAEVVADQLRRTLGADVRAYNQEWQAYQDSLRAGDYDLARSAWIGDYLDPNTFLDLFVSGGGNNQTGWGDARYDAWIRGAADPAGFARAARAAGAGPALEAREPDALRARLAAVAAAPDAAARTDALAALRLQLLREAEAILVQEAFPVLPVYTYVVSGLVKPRVGGFHGELVDDDGTRRPNLQDLHPLRGMWVRP